MSASRSRRSASSVAGIDDAVVGERAVVIGRDRQVLLERTLRRTIHHLIVRLASAKRQNEPPTSTTRTSNAKGRDIEAVMRAHT